MSYRVEQVLVPLDLSEFSRAALEFARGLRLGKKRPLIQVAHAVPPLAPHLRRVLFPYAPLGEDDREFEAELVEASRVELYDRFGLDDDDLHLLSDPWIEPGEPRVLITDWVRRVDADLIAIGAFGTTGAFPGGLGSTTQRLLRTTSRPVAVLRDFDPNPRVRKILVAVDLSDQTPEVLRIAASLAIQTDAELDLIHVIPSPWLHDTRSLVKRALKTSHADLSKSLKSTVDAHFERALENLELPFADEENASTLLSHLSVDIGDPAGLVTERAYQEGHDLIVVGTSSNHRSHGSLGRIAHRILVTAPTHVLAVPPARTKTPLVEAEET